MYKYKARKVKGKRIDEHRLIMEAHLGRKLSFNEVVHHKDGDKKNNKIENLELMSRAEHSKYHMTGDLYPFTREQAVLRGRKSRPTAKLTIEQVREIREIIKTGCKYTTIASMFGVGRNAIGKIKRGQSWAWIDPELTI